MQSQQQLGFFLFNQPIFLQLNIDSGQAGFPK